MPSSSSPGAIVHPFGSIALKDILRLSYVPRWVIVPMLRQQTVSDHSWRVAVIAMALAHYLDMSPDITSQVIMMSLVHDAGEAFTGDIPSTSPYKTQDIPTDLVGLIVKVADLIEAKWWAFAWAHDHVSSIVSGSVDERLQRFVYALGGMVTGAESAVRLVELEVSRA